MSARSLPRLPPLLPTGTARAQFQGSSPASRGDGGEVLPPELRAVLAAHDVSDEILWAAWEVTQWAQPAPEAERRALACLVVALLTTIEGGGTCLPVGAREGPTALPGRPTAHEGREGLAAVLAGLGVGEADAKAAGALATDLLAPPSDPAGATAWAPALLALFDAANGAEPATSPRRPFILRDRAIYPERLWWLEGRLLTLLTRRFGRGAAAAPLAAAAATDNALRELLDGEGSPPLANEQVAAVRAALTNPLTLVAGGPGTGKTWTVVALLRTLVRLGIPPEAVALAAPTGRAAQRMKESVEGALSRLKSPGAADVTLTTRFAGATTLHRLLGIRSGGPRALEPDLPEFYADWPLPHRVVIVDEASMIDLVLMDQLCAAVSPQAHLILIGDIDQLPSVQVGAVFRDLVAIAPTVTCRLTHSHRMDPQDPAGADILRVAAAVNAGRAETATLTHRVRAADLVFAGAEHLAAESLDDLLDRWHCEVLSAERTAELALDHRYAIDEHNYVSGTPASDAGAAMRTLLDTVLGARILCLTRTAGRTSSAAAINRLLHARVQAAALARGVDESMAGAAFVPGEPVIVLRNDQTLGLANGDLGVILRVRGGHGDRLGVAFARGEGFVVHPLDSIRADVALAFALTVHKAQGSEYQRVALVLPEVDVPLLTREVLYTALTRARHGVVVVGAPALLALGASRTISRTSGIARRMAALASSTAPAASAPPCD